MGVHLVLGTVLGWMYNISKYADESYPQIEESGRRLCTAMPLESVRNLAASTEDMEDTL